MNVEEEIFRKELATQTILSNVTSVCQKCYSSFREGEVIYFQHEELRYVCHSCHAGILEEKGCIINYLDEIAIEAKL